MLSPTASRPLGQWVVTDDGLRWWFDSGALALDLGVTGPFGDDAPLGTGEQLRTPADLAAWLEPRFPEVDGTVGDGDLRDALALRASIVRVAISIGRDLTPSPGDVDAINLYAAVPDIPPVLRGGSRQAGRAIARTSQALSVIAREAVQLFSDEPERLRFCAGGCGVLFCDASRTANRRWCSMARCGNRAKVRAHRARARSGA